MTDLIALYCQIDDFWQMFRNEGEQHFIDSRAGKRGPDTEYPFQKDEPL